MKQLQNPPQQVNSSFLFLSHRTLTVAFISFSSDNVCDHVLLTPAEKHALHLLSQKKRPRLQILKIEPEEKPQQSNALSVSQSVRALKKHRLSSFLVNRQCVSKYLENNLIPHSQRYID